MIRPSARGSEGAASGVEIEDIGGNLLIRPVGERAREQAELLAGMARHDDTTVVVVAVPDRLADALWVRLAEVRARTDGRRIVLAMSGTGDDRPDQAALGRRIADAWERTVVAPAGDAVLVPGGTLFASAGTSEADPQWWSFAPGAEPEPLGPRWPVPEWGAAVADPPMPHSGAVAGPSLTQVPAGLLVRRPGTAALMPGDVAYAVPAVPDRPSILVGVPDGTRVTAADLIAVLTEPITRPDWRRHPLRLVPGDGTDLLALGETLARELRVDVEVLTGLPVDVVDVRVPAEGTDGPRVVLADAAGRPTWSPFVASVICRPPAGDGTAPIPRPETWYPPVPGMDVTTTRGVLRLDDTWRLAVTRAGMWVLPADADPDRFPGELVVRWPAAVDTVRLDIGLADGQVDDEVWPLLDDLLGRLPAELRARLVVAVHGATTAAGDLALRRVTGTHDVRLEPATAAATRAGLSPGAPGPMVSAVAVPPPATVPGTRGRPAARRSTEEERDAFRAMIGLRWDAHAAPVRRAFSQLPALGAGERAAAAADLVAVRLYLLAQQTEPDGDFGSAAIRSGDERLRPYLACLASGLHRLPTYRGAVLRGVDAAGLDLNRLRPGSTALTEPGPVGGRALPPKTGYGLPQTTGAYVIWSDTARRLSALLDPEPAGAVPVTGDDVVFTPGTRFAVLDIRRGDSDAPDLALLRELPEPVDGTDPIDDADATDLALTRLEEAMNTVALDAFAGTPWPAHCVGPVGTPNATSDHVAAG